MKNQQFLYMKTSIISIVLLIFLCISVSIYSQELDSVPPLGTELIQQGIKLSDQGEYEAAIEIFKKVSPCDPTFPYACYKTVVALDYQGNYEAALRKYQEALDLDPTDLQTAILKGNLLDELHRTDEAITWLKKMEVNYPYSQNLLYNLALCFINNNQPETAEKVLIRGLHINPYHFSSHLALARVNSIMGKKAQSYLAYNMGIVMNPSMQNVKAFESAISGQFDSISKSYLYVSPTPGKYSKWDGLTGLLNSELAFNKDFPYNYKLNFLSCRESYLLFQKMNFDPQDTSFYNQFYVRFFKDILDKQEFETYLYYTLKNTNNEAVSEWISKNESTLNSFVDRAQATIESWKEYGFSVSNVNLSGIYPRINGILDGDEKEFNTAKDLISSYPYKQGSIEGIVEYNNRNDGYSWKASYHSNKLDGQLNVTGRYKNGNRDGIWKWYNVLGMVESEESWKEGLRSGIQKYYHDNGTPELIYQCDSDKVTGKLIRYFENGHLSLIGYYDKNDKTGLWIRYFSNDSVESQSFYANNTHVGRRINYSPDGKPVSEETFNDEGIGIRTKYFDVNGNMFEDVSFPDDSSVVSLHFPNGKLRAKLPMRAYHHNGCIEFYYPNGQMRSQENPPSGLSA